MENMIFFLVGVSVAGIIFGGWLYSLKQVFKQKEEYYKAEIKLYKINLDAIGYNLDQDRNKATIKLQRVARAALIKGGVIARRRKEVCGS